MSSLAEKRCVPCKGGIPPLKRGELRELHEHLGGSWKIIAGHHLEKEFRFKNFREALEFTNKIGELAEQEGHHPDIYLAWGKAKVTLWTHKINGLHENDFILAAKIDRCNYPHTRL